MFQRTWTRRDIGDRLRKIIEAKPNLGEFSLPSRYWPGEIQPLPNAFSALSIGSGKEDTDTPETEGEIYVARQANKEKTFPITPDTVREMGDWMNFLTDRGFEVLTVNPNADGEIVSATCSKDGVTQVITPQIKALIN